MLTKRTKGDNAREAVPDFTLHELRLLFENEVGICPLCGRDRGFSVPDECADNSECPEPEDIERQLLR